MTRFDELERRTDRHRMTA